MLTNTRVIQLKRDSSYRQGTVWPWLLGPFITAYIRVAPDPTETRETARAWIEKFEDHLKVAGLEQIPEIADAACPHVPRGCIAQARSVAELLRAAVEDVDLGQRQAATGAAAD
jgi:glycogen debranching enzyme